MKAVEANARKPNQAASASIVTLKSRRFSSRNVGSRQHKYRTKGR